MNLKTWVISQENKRINSCKLLENTYKLPVLTEFALFIKIFSKTIVANFINTRITFLIYNFDENQCSKKEIVTKNIEQLKPIISLHTEKSGYI